MALKLGKKPFVPDERDIKFSVVKAGLALPTPPRIFGHGKDFADWEMLGNGPDDSVEPGFQGAGDCVFADAGHGTMLTNKIGGRPVKITGKEAIADYSTVTGYVIGDDSTDQGTEVRVALAFRQKTGTLDAAGNRHKIGAYVSVNAKDPVELMQAAYVFTALSIGFEFPDTAMDQFNNGQVWDVESGATIEGGHDVIVTGRTAADNIGVVTWAKRQGMTRKFYETYNDETWAIVFPEELANGKTYRGLDLSGLNAALKLLK